MKPLPLRILGTVLLLLLWGLIFCVSKVAGDCSQIFEYLVLQRHNEFRHRHGVGPLHINATLTREAQLLANKMKLENRLLHESPLGENLYAYWHPAGHSPDPNKVVDRWYSEVKAYQKNYGHEPNLSEQSSWIHFTNLIWRQTTDIGIGCAVSKSEETSYLVVRYWPVGNVRGHYSENILPMLEPTTQVIPYINLITTSTTAGLVAISQSLATLSTTTAKSTTGYVPPRTTKMYKTSTPLFSTLSVQKVTLNPNITSLSYPTTIKSVSSSSQPSTAGSINLVQSGNPIVTSYSKPTSQNLTTVARISQQTTLYLTTKLPYTKPNKYTTAKTTVYQKPVQYVTIKVTYNKPNVSTSLSPIINLKPIEILSTKPPYRKPTVYVQSSTTIYSKPIKILSTKPLYTKPNTYTTSKPAVYTKPTQYYTTTKKPYVNPSTTNYQKPIQFSTAKPPCNKPIVYVAPNPTIYQKPIQYSTTRKPYYMPSTFTTINSTVYQPPFESAPLNVAYNPPVTYPPPSSSVEYVTTTTAIPPAYIPPNRPFSQLIIHHGPYETVLDQPIPIYNSLPHRPAPQRPNVVPVIQYYPDKPYQQVEEEKPVQMPSNSYLPILPVKPVTETYNQQYNVPQTIPPSAQQQPVYRPPKPVENGPPEQPMYPIYQQQHQQYRPPKPIVINTLPEYRPPLQQPVYDGPSKPPSYSHNKPASPPYSQINYYHPPKPITSPPAKPINYYLPSKPNQTPKPNYQMGYYIPPKPQQVKPPQNNYYFPPKPVVSQPNRPPHSMYRPPKPISPSITRPIYSPHRPKPIDHIDPNSPHLNFDDHDADDLLETAFELADDYDKKDKEKDIEKYIENMKNSNKNANAKTNERDQQKTVTNDIKNKNIVFRESNILKKDDFENEKSFINEKIANGKMKIKKTNKTAKSKQTGLLKKSTKLEKHNKSGKNKREEDSESLIDNFNNSFLCR